MHELIDNRGALVLKILIEIFFTWARFFILFYIFSNIYIYISHEKEERKKMEYNEN